MQLTVMLLPDREGGFTAMNPETGTTTQGETIDEALADLREARSSIWRNFRSNRMENRWSQ